MAVLLCVSTAQAWLLAIGHRAGTINFAKPEWFLV
jgi:hypothetical protein